VFTTRSTAPSPARADAAAAPPPADSPTLTGKEQAWWLCFVALHAPLGLWMHAESITVWVHGVLCLAIGGWWALNPSRPDRVACVAAYIAGAEVFWRMVTDALPWETAKFGLVLIYAAALLSRFGLASLVAPAMCFSLLLPSVAVTASEADPALLRGMLSFNLSGPFSLAMSAAFFWRLKLDPHQVVRVFMSLLAPIVAIGAIVLYNIVTADHLEFSFESNPQTSGGFGPNQVSLALGLGALACFWCQLERGVRWSARVMLFILMLWLGAHCALTFSRGGMLGASASAAIAIGLLMLDRDARRKAVLVVPLLVGLGMFVIWPALVEFTGGNLAVRYSETGLSHRDQLGWQDIDIWMRNPVLGVGPGMSQRYHSGGVVAHTEFTRMLAEHGFFGALAMALLVGIGVVNAVRAPSPREKALVAAALTWSVLYMLNSAMRTVAPSFMFGLSCCVLAAHARLPSQLVAPDRVAAPRRVLVGGRASAA